MKKSRAIVIAGAMVAMAILYQLVFASSAVQPSVGLYWTSTTDPAAGGGVCAPLWQLLYRTDNNSLYVKTGTACTGWTLFGSSASGTVTSVSGTAPISVATGTTTPVISISAATENGQALAYNGTAWSSYDGLVDPSLAFYQVEEFTQFLTNCTSVGSTFIGTASGAGSGCAVTAATGYPGIIALHTGTTATGYARFRNNGLLIQPGGNFGNSCTRWLVQWPTLSNTTIEYLTRFGFIDSITNAESTNAAEAVYDRAGVGTMIALRNCRAGCTTVKCDGTGGTTLVTINAATWYTMEVCINSAGTQSSLSVNGVQCATNSSNVPTQVSWGAQMANNSGSVPADENFFIDYEATRVPFTVAR